MAPTLGTPEEVYAKDLSVGCRVCDAEPLMPCTEAGVGLKGPTGNPVVHLTRRLQWLVAENRPDLMPPKH